MNTVKLRVIGLGTALIFFPLLGGCQDNNEREKLVEEQQHRTMDTQLDLYILEQNAVLPAMQDKNTRWDSVSRKDDLFYYNFSVVNLGANAFNKEIFDQSVAPNLVVQTCQDQKRRNLIDNGYTIVFRYIDEAKKELSEVRVSQDHC